MKVYRDPLLKTWYHPSYFSVFWRFDEWSKFKNHQPDWTLFDMAGYLSLIAGGSTKNMVVLIQGFSLLFLFLRQKMDSWHVLRRKIFVKWRFRYLRRRYLSFEAVEGRQQMTGKHVEPRQITLEGLVPKNGMALKSRKKDKANKMNAIFFGKVLTGLYVLGLFPLNFYFFQHFRNVHHLCWLW